MEPSGLIPTTAPQLQDWSIQSPCGSISYDESSYYPMSMPISPQDVPATPSDSFSSIGLPDTPAAILDSPPFMAYSPSTSPQFPFAATSPGVQFCHPSPFSVPMPCKQESFESPSGAPLFQPRPMYCWSQPLKRSASFESSSPLSFSSSSQGSASSFGSSFYPGDYMSGTSTPTSFYPIRSTLSPSCIEESPNTQPEARATLNAAATPIQSNYLYSENPRDKQPPYATIIYQALMSHPQRKMVLSEIYSFFRAKHPERAARDGGWKNSIRHNLSMNGAFVKEPRPSDDNTKRFIWVLSEDAQKNGIKSTTRYRRNTPRAPTIKRAHQVSRRRPTRSSSNSGGSGSNITRSCAATPATPHPLPLPQLHQARVEHLDQPPPTPPESPPYADVYALRMTYPEAKHFGMENHSPNPPSVFDDIHFEEDGISVLDAESGVWQKAPYADDHFHEQFSITRVDEQQHYHHQE